MEIPRTKNLQRRKKETKQETKGETAESKAEESKGAGETTASGTDLSKVKIGAFTSNNKDDGGWSQAQYTGLAAAVKNLGLSEDQFLFY